MSLPDIKIHLMPSDGVDPNAYERAARCDCGHPRTLHGAGKIAGWCVVEGCACGNYRPAGAP